MKKHVTLLLALVLFIVTILSSATAEIVLDCLHWKNEGAEGFEALAEAFNELYPDVTVELTASGDNYKQLLMGRLSANDVPALVAVPSGKYGFDVPKGGYMLDLSDWAGLENLKPELVEAQRYNGKVYSIPVDCAAHGVVYNREIFNKYGLNVPTTWDEFKNVCQTLKDNGITPLIITGKDPWTLGIMGVTLAAPIYGKNANFDMDVIEGKASFNGPEWKKVFEDYEVLRQYANEDVASLSYSLGNQMIANGEAAMTIQGNWVVSAIREFNPEVELGIFAIPNAENQADNTLIWGPDFTIGISSTTKNPEECYAFLDFLTSLEGSKIWTDNIMTFSAVKGSDMTFDQTAKDINAILESGIKTYPLVNHEWFMENVWLDWGASIQEYNNGTITAEDCLEYLEKTIKAAYEIYIK